MRGIGPRSGMLPKFLECGFSYLTLLKFIDRQNAVLLLELSE
jgi:hypothetical protein